jgi:hypothetical protein
MAKEHNTNPEPGVTGEASELTVLLADDDAAIRRLAGAGPPVLRIHGA